MTIRLGRMQHRYVSYTGLFILLAGLVFLTACNVSYLEKFGEFDAQQGNYEEAIKDYTKAIRYAPHDPVPLVSRGYAYQKMGRHDEAIADYTKAIQLSPADAELYLIRGVAYSLKGLNDQAILDYSKAIAIDPRNADAYFNRAQSYEAKNMNDKAVEDYKAAARLNNPRAQGVLMGRKISW
jgi:tetratricopeptide (TPR) repeat protein